MGPIELDRLTLASSGRARVAVIGTCPITATRLSELIATVGSVAELDALASRFSGSWQLVASVSGVVRVQGSLAGLRRVFHTRVGGVPVAGGRADVLAALSGAGIDEHALAMRVVCGRQTPPPLSERSFWRGVHAVAPDHYLRLDRSGAVSEVRWWYPPEPDQPLPAVAPMVGTALREAVAVRQPAVGRLSSDLSGGFDSTSLCLLAAAQTPELLTLRWAEAEAGNDDAVFAAHAVAAMADAEHLIIPQCELPAQFAEVAGLGDLEEPLVFGRALAGVRHDAALLAGYGSRVHLAGHGGDELFEGGRTQYLHTLVRRRPLAAVARVRAHRSMGRWSWLAACAALAALGDIGSWLRAQAEELAEGPVPRHTPILGWGYPIRAPRWVSPSALDMARSSLRAAAEVARPLASDRGQHATLATLRIAGPLYRQLVRIFAGAGVRLELPYLDDRVIAAVLAARLDERIDPWRYKPLLAEAMRGVLPAPIAARTTKGEFSADVRSGLRRNLPRLLEVFADSALAQRGLIDSDAVRAALLAPQVDGAAMSAVQDLLGCENWLRATQKPPAPPLTRNPHAPAPAP